MDIRDYMKQFEVLNKMLSEIPMQSLDKIKIKSYEPKEYIIKRGAYEKSLIIILYGICDVVKDYDTGQRFISYKVTIMDIIGFSELFSPNMKREVDIIARTKVTIAIIPSTVVLECFGKYQSFSVAVTNKIIGRLHQRISLLMECNNYPSNLSIITYLLYAYHFYKKKYPKEYTGYVKIDESRQDMSTIIGVNIRTVNRAAEKLRNDNVIVIEKGKICINSDGYIKLIDLKMINSL